MLQRITRRGSCSCSASQQTQPQPDKPPTRPLAGVLNFSTLLAALLLGGSPVVEASEFNRSCRAMGTVGFHDYGGAPQRFESAVFHESVFEIEENRLLGTHLRSGPSVASASTTYLTLVQDQTRQELECVPIRLPGNAKGLSCTNQPPTTLLLINPASGRFTRSSLAAWTFSKSQFKAGTEKVADQPKAQLPSEHSGESMFIEHGRCHPSSG